MPTGNDIMFELGKYFVLREPNQYLVMQNMGHYSESDSAYAKDGDGLSIAIARAKYLHEYRS